MKKRPQYSKILVLVTGIIFLICLWYCLTRDASNVYDMSLYTGAVTITGGVFGSAIIWYEKKSQAENVSKIKLQHVKDVAKIEFNLYEKKIRLQKELGIIGETDTDAGDDGDSYIDDQLGKAVEQDGSYLDDKESDATSEPEIQTY